MKTSLPSLHPFHPFHPTPIKLRLPAAASYGGAATGDRIFIIQFMRLPAAVCQVIAEFRWWESNTSPLRCWWRALATCLSSTSRTTPCVKVHLYLVESKMGLIWINWGVGDWTIHNASTLHITGRVRYYKHGAACLHVGSVDAQVLLKNRLVRESEHRTRLWSFLSAIANLAHDWEPKFVRKYNNPSQPSKPLRTVIEEVDASPNVKYNDNPMRRCASLYTKQMIRDGKIGVANK